MAAVPLDLRPEILRRRVLAAPYRFVAQERLRRCTVVVCRLETGRTHQIRIHLAHIGHPIVGDTMYISIVDSGQLFALDIAGGLRRLRKKRRIDMAFIQPPQGNTLHNFDNDHLDHRDGIRAYMAYTVELVKKYPDRFIGGEPAAFELSRSDDACGFGVPPAAGVRSGPGRE